MRRSLSDPAFDARTNVEGTINVLEAARTVRRRTPRGSSSPRRAARSTARPTSCRRPRPSSRCRWPPTARASSAPSATSASTSASTACRRSRCASATSTARARTRTARPGVIAIFCGRMHRRRAPADLRRRHADARLHLRGGPRRGAAGRGGAPRRAASSTSAPRSRHRCWSCSRSSATSTARTRRRRSSRPRASARSTARASTRRSRASCWAGRRARRSPRACA